MNRVTPKEDWPGSWIASYNYDRIEIYGETSQLGYSYAYRNRLEQTLNMVRKVAPTGSKILDVAAAQGNFSLALAEAGYEVTWNDLREDLIGYVKLKDSKGALGYLPGNILEMSGPESLYDLVIITEIIEHVAHPDQFLKKVTNLVRPGGFIVMTTPNGQYFCNHLPKFSDCANPSEFESAQFKPNSDGHIFLLHEDEVHRFAQECGLIVRELRLFTTPLTNGHAKTECLLYVLPRTSVFWLESIGQKLPAALKRKICAQMGVIFEKPARTGQA